MRKLIAIALFSVCVLAAAGCNTMRGIGEDIQWVGQELQDAAD